MQLYCNLIDPGVSEMKVLLYRDGPDISCVDAVAAYVVLPTAAFCAYISLLKLS